MPKRQQRPAWADALVAAGAAFALRAWLILAYPAMFGGDSILRLANADRILLSHQLPLLQVGVHVVSLLSDDLAWSRWLVALFAAAATAGFYRLSSALAGRSTGFAAAMLFAVNPFVAAFSTVPYQEILMLAGLFFAFAWAFENKPGRASIALGVACLTRYEAWIACPVLFALELARGPIRPRALVRAALLHGWAPAAWILFNQGLSPGGTSVLDAGFNIERFGRWAYLGWITVKNTPLPALLLAALGAWALWKQERLREERYRSLLAFLALFLVAILFSAHGDRDRPDLFVSAREAHVLLAAAAFLGAVGLAQCGKFRVGLLALSLTLGAVMADRFIARETAEPHVRLSYEVAQYVRRNLPAEDRAVVLAKAITREQLERYLALAERRGGEEGLRRAWRTLSELNVSPPDYQRVFVQAGRAKRRLLSLASLPSDLAPQPAPLAARDIDWAFIWSDFSPTNDVETRVYDDALRSEPARTWRENGVSISLYRLDRH